MKADDLRGPLTDSEQVLLIGSCAESQVVLKVVDPDVLARVAALLPDVKSADTKRAAS
jgi:hypothetical protein